MKTMLYVFAACMLFATQAGAQEDPYASAPASNSGAPAVESAFADDAPPINGALFGLGLVSFRFGDVGFGVGARYQHAIVPSGFLRSVASIRDELMLEGGLDFHTATISRGGTVQTGFGTVVSTGGPSYSYSILEFSVAAVWELWFTPDFAAYPRLGFGFDVGISDYASSVFVGVAGAGVLYKLGALVLRAEISNFSLAAGAGLAF